MRCIIVLVGLFFLNSCTSKKDRGKEPFSIDQPKMRDVGLSKSVLRNLDPDGLGYLEKTAKDLLTLKWAAGQKENISKIVAISEGDLIRIMNTDKGITGFVIVVFEWPEESDLPGAGKTQYLPVRDDKVVMKYLDGTPEIALGELSLSAKEYFGNP